MPLRTDLKAAVKVILGGAGFVPTYFDEADSVVINDFENKKVLQKIGKCLITAPGNPTIVQTMNNVRTEVYTLVASAFIRKRDQSGEALKDIADAYRKALHTSFDSNRTTLWAAFSDSTGLVLSTNFNNVILSGPESDYADDGGSVVINAGIIVNLTRKVS